MTFSSNLTAQDTAQDESKDLPGTTAISKDVHESGTTDAGSQVEEEESGTVGITEPEDIEGDTRIIKPAVVTGVTALSQAYEERKSVRIPHTATAPVLDGILSEGEWDNAVVITDMHQFLPVDHGVPSERSEFYLMYDADNLYVGARLWDSEPDKIIARQLVQGQGMPFDDAFEFILDPFNNMRSGYKFQLNPNAIRRDGIFENASELNQNWDGIWDAEAQTDEQGWTAEVVIPFKTLNFNPDNPDWGFTIARTIARKKEELAWSSYDRRLNPGTTGVLRGLEGVEQGMGLDIVPSITVGEETDFITDDTDLVFEPSLDVSYNITPSLTGSLTVNTDFSATEIDDRQVNLNRFALFYPEKRAFFLQDADIFSFGGLGQNGIPFFSRKIGLDLFGEPVDLDAGVKLTGRVGNWNIGALGVRQAGSGNVDASMLMVGRATINVLEESEVGAIMTYGDPLSNRENYVFGSDFRYRNTHFMGNRRLTGNIWGQQSHTPGLTGDERAWGARLNVGVSEGLGGGLNYERFGDAFNPALGFANRTGITRVEASLANRIRPEDHPLVRSIMSFARFEYIENLDGDLETMAIFSRPIGIETHRGDDIGLLLFRGREVLVNPFEISPGVVIQPGDYTFNRIAVELRTAPERVFAPRLAVFMGEFYNGDRLNVRSGFDWRPNEHFFLGVDFDYNNIDLPAGDFETRLMSMRANWAFNAEWSFLNLVQYDNFSNIVGVNSRLHWNPRAGEDFYVVLNYNFDSVGTFRGISSRDNELLLKYTKTFRF